MAEEVVKTYWAKFGLDATNFLNGITAAQKEFLTFTAGVAASVAVFTLAFNEYSRLVQKYGQMANDLQDLSYATGISTEEIQRFHYAAKLSGDDIGMVDAMLSKLTLSMGQFTDKTSPAAKAFQQLGVDPAGKSTSQVFEEIAAAMSDIPNAGTRASIGVDILGRSYRDSLPYMKDYVENSEKIKKAVTFSPEEQQAMADYKQGLDDLGNSWEVFWGKALFGKPEATKEKVDSILQYYQTLGYGEEEIKKALVSNYGLSALQKLGYYTESAESAKSSRIDFKDQFANLDETGVKLAQLNADLADYNDAMEAARQSGDQEAFEKAAAGARITQLAIDELGKAGKLTQTEISKIKNSLDDLTKYSIPEQREEVKKLEKAYKEIGDKSSQAAKDAKREWEHAQNTLNGYLIQQQEASEKLTKAGVSTSASGGSTYNELFKASINTGGVGPDTAGYSDLANMSEAELQEIAKGGLGKSKGFAEKAQAYLDRMGSTGSGTASTASKTTTTPGSTDQTKTVETEYDKQTTALATLTDKTTKEYQKQSDAFKKHMDGIQALREKQYPILEVLDLTHFATFEETARVGQQAVLNNMAKLVNFAGQNPIIQNSIIMSAKGPDWTPPTFTPITAPTLASADFTQVGAAVQAIVAKGLGDGTSGTAAAKAAVTKVTVVIEDKTSGGVRAELASANGVGGGN